MHAYLQIYAHSGYKSMEMKALKVCFQKWDVVQKVYNSISMDVIAEVTKTNSYANNRFFFRNMLNFFHYSLEI